MSIKSALHVIERNQTNRSFFQTTCQHSRFITLFITFTLLFLYTRDYKLSRRIRISIFNSASLFRSECYSHLTHIFFSENIYDGCTLCGAFLVACLLFCDSVCKTVDLPRRAKWGFYWEVCLKLGVDNVNLGKVDK